MAGPSAAVMPMGGTGMGKPRVAATRPSSSIANMDQLARVLNATQAGGAGATAAGAGNVPAQVRPYLAQQGAVTSAAPGGGGAAAGGGGSLTNTAEKDENVGWLLDTVKSRVTGPGVAERAIDRAASATRDFAAGQSARLKGRMARMGTLGSGVHEQGDQAIEDRAAKSFAGQAADISMGRERDIDTILAQQAGTFAEPARLAMDEKRINLSQRDSQVNEALARAQQAQEQQRFILSLLK